MNPDVIIRQLNGVRIPHCSVECQVPSGTICASNNLQQLDSYALNNPLITNHMQL